MHRVLQLVVQGPPQVRELLVVELDDVEAVEHQTASRRWVVTASMYAGDMSVATASIRAREWRSRIQKAVNASPPLPWPTRTTAPLSRSNTIVR